MPKLHSKSLEKRHCLLLDIVLYSCWSKAQIGNSTMMVLFPPFRKRTVAIPASGVGPLFLEGISKSASEKRKRGRDLIPATFDDCISAVRYPDCYFLPPRKKPAKPMRSSRPMPSLKSMPATLPSNTALARLPRMSSETPWDTSTPSGAAEPNNA